MIPIDFVHAPSAQKPPPNSDEQTLAQYRQVQRQMALPKVAAERVNVLRSAMDHEGEHNRPLWVVVDGGFTNRTFLKNLPNQTVFVGRVRADAKLYYQPQSTQGKPGRNRAYGDRAPTPEQFRKDSSVPWQFHEAFAAGKTHLFKYKTIAPLRWRPAGQNRDLRLVVIAPLGYRPTQHSRLLYRKPAYLLCTDPDASIQQLIQHYIWRWDIEVNFRDEKTLLGVGQAQVQKKHSVENVPALAVAAYAMLLTAATQAYGPLGTPKTLPQPKWRNKKPMRASTQSLIQQLRIELWADAIHFSSFDSQQAPYTKPQKCDPNLATALFYSVA
jgi:hypothetical protein